MIAIDMPMPKGCEDCPCFHSAACYAEGWRKSIALGWLERKEKREEWCPLIDLTQYEDDLK
jgi:hypothetical protein